MTNITSLSPIYIDSRSGSGPVSRKSNSNSKGKTDKSTVTRYRGLLEYSPLNLCSDCHSPCHFIGGRDQHDYENGVWSCPSNPTHSPICELSYLDSADVFFLGNGWSGDTLSIGVEVKSITDLLSCLQTGRLVNEQVPKMLAGYDVQWILYYGYHRAHPSTGTLQLGRLDPDTWKKPTLQTPPDQWKPKPKQAISWYDYQPSISSRTLPYGYLESRLLTLTSRGIHCKFTPTIQDACYFIASLYRWWSKDRSEDEKHLQVEDKRFSVAPTLDPDPELRKRLAFAMRLPGLSHERGLSAAKHFPSIESMVIAGESDWTAIRGIGKGTAQAIKRYLTGRSKA